MNKKKVTQLKSFDFNAPLSSHDWKKAVRHLNDLLEQKNISEAKLYCQKILDLDHASDQRNSKAPHLKRPGFKFSFDEIIGQSSKMLKVLNALERIIPTDIPVWIQGESGTGKELIARALHFNHPKRKQHAFMTENCSAIPENLIESLLFGYVKGAFTHAERDKEGIFEAADGGTIFLDEIGDMPLSMQSKLLRVLQEKEIRRVGSNEAIPIDVRVLSATNKNLSQMVQQGTFREDLYFRLNGFKLAIPPLREHKEDLPELCEFFLKKYASKGDPSWSIEKSALEALIQYAWPGNVRELENTIHNAMLFSEKNVVNLKSLVFKTEIFEKPDEVKSANPVSSSQVDRVFVSQNTQDEDREPREAILDAMEKAGFHKGKAAKELNITTRHLYNLLERYGLPKNKWVLKRLLQEERG